MKPATSTEGEPPIRTQIVLLLLGAALFVAALALIFHDLTHSNRPHELRFPPLVVTLLSINGGLSWYVLRGLSRRPLGAGAHPLLFGLGLTFAIVNALVWFPAVGTLIG